MEAEENKVLCQRCMEEVWNKGNLAVLDGLFDPNYVEHSPMPGQAPGIEGHKDMVTMARAAFPDMHSHIEDMIAEGDKVVIRMTAHGTHKGEFMGIPATGKGFNISEIHIVRIVNGKAVEHWSEADMLGFMQQLGVVSPPG